MRPTTARRRRRFAAFARLLPKRPAPLVQSVSAKKMTSDDRDRLQDLAGTLQAIGALAWFAMPAAFLYFFHLLKVSPQTSDTIHSFRLYNHGHDFYVTLTQCVMFYGLLVGGGAAFLALMMIGKLLERRARRPDLS